MKKKIFYSLLTGILIAGFNKPGQAQFFDKLGSNAISAQDFNYSICAFSGVFVASGTMMNSTTGNLDVSALLFDAAGTIFWNRVYDINGGNNDFSGKIRATPLGTIIVGTTGGQFANPKNIFAMLLDGSGNVTAQVIYTTNNPAINTYGMDAVYEPSDNTFIITGMGDYTTTNIEHENRFGLVFKVTSNLNTVLWSNKYMTSPTSCGSYFDCINDIERFTSTSGTIYYYLTGSLTDNGPTQDVLNMLIDNTGSLVWDKPFNGSNQSGGYHDRGTNAVFDGVNTIYLLHQCSETHSPNIATINFTTGNLSANNFIAPLGVYTNVAYTMDWDVTHKYLLMQGIASDINYLVEIDPKNICGAPIWQRSYPPVFSSDLQNITYDWVLKPANNIPSQSYEMAAPFFSPHTFVNDQVVGDGIGGNPIMVFATSQSPFASGVMNNLRLQTNHLGQIPVGTACYETQTSSICSLQHYTAVTPGAYTSYPISILPATVSNTLTPRNDVSPCGAKPANNNISQNPVALNLYPNPAKDIINIDVPSNMSIKNIYIIDALGKRINYSNVISKQALKLNIANLAAGIYWVEITTATEIKHLKFVKS